MLAIPKVPIGAPGDPQPIIGVALCRMSCVMQSGSAFHFRASADNRAILANCPHVDANFRRAGTAFRSQHRPQPHGRARKSSLMLVAIVHVVVIYLLTLSPAREAIVNASALMVTLIRESPRAEQRPVDLPTPRPAKLQPVAIEPVPVPLPTIVTAPTDINVSAIAREAPAAAVIAVQAPVAAATVVAPPRFDANYLTNPAPVYPALSKRLGEEGRVILRVHIDASGNSMEVEIRASSGSPRLDTAAIEAVRRWKFVPAKQGEKVVAAWVLVPINFSLRNTA
ncbi:MAG: energy transducer TonB [Betaproteobacteria bacterium]